MLDGRGSLIITVDRPKARFGNCQLPAVSRPEASILEGDDQADRKAHGGPDKSVYAYSIEDVRWWEETLGRSLQYGEFGLRRITTTFPVGCSLENAIATRRNLELF